MKLIDDFILNMINIYSSGKLCMKNEYINKICCFEFDLDFNDLMVKLCDYDELLWGWKSW